ncbi:hypothetical protein GCM10023172_32990 [Hymenobacter ginsengisoli]|uniref:Uncharacterized protein n=1 Tax=Hymenobacter ginsengisoli TaxID=1051626 RepID=A0ABP8QPG8_9BACT
MGSIRVAAPGNGRTGRAAAAGFSGIADAGNYPAHRNGKCADGTLLQGPDCAYYLRLFTEEGEATCWLTA